MIKTSGIRRAVAAVVGLALVGSLTAFASAGPASAADAEVTRAALLSAGDLDRAGWDDTSAFKEVAADLLLTQCGGDLPYWSPGFEALQRRGFQKGTDPVFGTELVMAFRTSHDAKAYATDYAFSVDSACVYTYGAKRWDVRSAADLHLAHRAQHAQTWTVRDTTTAGSQTLSITLVRDHERVALLWLSGEKGDDPTRSLDLAQLTQRAADRSIR